MWPRRRDFFNWNVYVQAWRLLEDFAAHTPRRAYVALLMLIDCGLFFFHLLSVINKRPHLQNSHWLQAGHWHCIDLPNPPYHLFFGCQLIIGSSVNFPAVKDCRPNSTARFCRPKNALALPFFQNSVKLRICSIMLYAALINEELWNDILERSTWSFYYLLAVSVMPWGCSVTKTMARVTISHALAFIWTEESEIMHRVCSLKISFLLFKIRTKHETMCNSYYGAAPIISAAHTDTYIAPYRSSSHSPVRIHMKLNSSPPVSRALGNPQNFWILDCGP